MAGKFEVYQDKQGKYRWRLKARNGQVVANGEYYDTQTAAVRGIRAAQRAAEGAEVYAEVHEVLRARSPRSRGSTRRAS